MIDVLLTHSYHLFYDRKQVRKMQPYPPLGTLYAAALLREKGFSVALFDSMLEDPVRGFPAAVARHQPRMVAICEDSFNFLSKMCLTRMREVAFGMIDTARRAGAKIIISGSDATDHLTRYIQHGADFVLLGEPEWTLLELVQSLTSKRGEGLEEIRGLAFGKGHDGEVIRTSPRSLMRDLDRLPLPARDLVNMERYRDAWAAAHGFFSLNIVGSRGCPYRCNWCAKPIYGDSFHLRSAQCIAQEIAVLKEKYGADHLWFADDIFGLKPAWLNHLADEVEKLNAAVPFKVQSRADLMRPDSVRALRRAGCVEVWMGVESGSQRILDAMDKGLRLEQVVAARESLRQAGIRACYFLQFGYAGEVWEDIQDTIALVRRTRPDEIGISVSYPLPGTGFYRRVREQLGPKANWIDSEDLSMMFRGAYTTQFYRALRDALHAEVDSWGLNRSGRFCPRPERESFQSAQSDNIPALWTRVEEMERTCRNSNPTWSPVFTCTKVEAGSTQRPIGVR